MKSVIANDQITAKSVRLVDESSSTVMAINAALDLAYSKEMDLIQVSDQDVPVVKIANLNKYLYDQKQAEKESKKKQRQNSTQVKEVQFSFGTQEHDLNTKAKSAQKFISEGKQVRVVMKIQGRTNSNPNILKQNTDCMGDFVTRLGDVDFVQNIAVQGNNVTCTIKAK
ncbi:Translation initiation factor 3 [Yersinia phage fHe-Yen9-04]|uniref:Translation initiation factor 3 n=2 Tax=Eneladusvirus Yen904 TaxID=2560849 RepID=A0A2C9CXP5_9CAUD|nr:translation initiation factor [Yersinia phage fHe-Yen9-04]SOK58591.1 Translation initiation factor 3 [Yersinia phage fHe-Yen9-04]SOK59125.1 Translation initiation factor 3 [Yersinia phage fHe-Yen9-03]VUE36360.1 Translation initiation factor 3 [Yersinia phage fHe-Yen9-04]